MGIIENYGASYVLGVINSWGIPRPFLASRKTRKLICILILPSHPRLLVRFSCYCFQEEYTLTRQSNVELGYGIHLRAQIDSK